MTAKINPGDLVVTVLLGQELQISMKKNVLTSQSGIFHFMLEHPFFDPRNPTVELSDSEPNQLLHFFQILKNNCECRVNAKNVAYLTVLAERFEVQWMKDEIDLFHMGYTSVNGDPDLAGCDAETLKKIARSRRRTTMMQSKGHETLVRFKRECSM